ncbi:hypothetical protein [Buchananella hordeovulneris]|uniref:hypothetical protein n=1 Tax=Buchananella hordeovulneris TaxID=52770 RepID=UPI0026DDAB1A|nr:hypothetical protein [Buchananella hordeovulneris]MDO5080221.1 hypothetical protein [Buchananella hordeovulneris]
MRSSKAIAAVVTGIGLVLAGCGQSEADGQPGAGADSSAAAQPDGDGGSEGSGAALGKFHAECAGKWSSEFVDVPAAQWEELVQQFPTEQVRHTVCDVADEAIGISVSVIAADSPLAAKAQEVAAGTRPTADSPEGGEWNERVVLTRMSADQLQKRQQEVAEFVAQAGGSGYTRYAPQRDALEFFGPTPVAKQVSEKFSAAEVFVNLAALSDFEKHFAVGAQAKGDYVPFHVWLDGAVNAIGHQSKLDSVQKMGGNICLTWQQEGQEQLIFLAPDFLFFGEKTIAEGLPEPGVEFGHGPWLELGPAACGGKVWPQAVALAG